MKYYKVEMYFAVEDDEGVEPLGVVVGDACTYASESLFGESQHFLGGFGPAEIIPGDDLTFAEELWRERQEIEAEAGT